MYISINLKIDKMRKKIDINDNLLTKVKIISAFEDISVKHLLEKAVSFYVEYKENELLKSLTNGEKEDLGFLLLMQQSDRNDVVTREEVINILDR
ncbi:hypothetical protein GCM10022216_28530 [Sphingobacterium kyonggiense]|uniref:RHH-type rel operon transcriptional repressor/antitoxin RelB n=2 Tax=Sphingobacterium kyonggiense TaxID=714075 RepID=A0ABP7Z0V8_9SPHI